MEQDWVIEGEAFVVYDVLTPAECVEYIAAAEDEGFHEAPINTRHGVQRIPEVRNNERVVVDRDDWADHFWECFSGLELPYLNGCEACGVNERFRVYRYEPSQRFAPHYDGHYARPDGSEVSGWSILIYLSDDFDGGETRFLPPEPLTEVVPEQGMALFFRHDMLHEGVEVTRGRKYVLRTDLMFRLG